MSVATREVPVGDLEGGSEEAAFWHLTLDVAYLLSHLVGLGQRPGLQLLCLLLYPPAATPAPRPGVCVQSMTKGPASSGH